MDSYQVAFEESLSKMPSIVIENLIKKKLGEQNIRLSDDAFKKLIKHVFDKNEGELEIPDEEIEFIDREPGALLLNFTKADREKIDKETKAFLIGMPKLIRKVTKKMSKDVVKRSKLQWLEDFGVRKSEMDAFTARLSYRWSGGLIPLNVMLEVAREFGQAVIHSHQEQIDKGALSKRRDVLFALHNRACQVVAEIITLLEAGYADGAMARWRTLHELSVVADIIHDGDDYLAERYLDHNVVDSKKAADKYMDTLKFTGFEPIARAELEQIKSDFDIMIAKHGKNFGFEYGWASEITGNQKNPKFIDLIKKSKRESQQPFYKMASFNVHANARSLFFRHTNMASHSGVISGASNAGLCEPGINTAYSLCQISANLLPDENPIIDNLIAVETLSRLRDNSVKGFELANQMLEDEDLEYFESGLDEEYYIIDDKTLE